MAKLYGPLYAKIWQESLMLPGYGDLPQSLASEVASYFRIDLAEAVSRLTYHWKERWQMVADRFPKGRSPEELHSYYLQQEHGLYTSIYWHSLQSDFYPLVSVAGLHLVQQLAEGKRLFEFGHGVGSTGILFARHGFDVSLGDISPNYRRFAEHRFRTRGLPVTFLDLNQRWPESESYDIVTSFDVVGVLDRIRQIGFERFPAEHLFVYYKQDLESWKRAIYRMQDMIDAATSDIAARSPRLGRILRFRSLPGI